MGEWYYLVDTTGLTVSQTPSSTWAINADGTICRVGSPNYYLRYDGGWGLTPIGTYYYITNGNHYLSATSANVTNATTAAASVKWALSSPTSSTTTIST